MKYEEAIDIVFERFPEFANSKELEEGYDKDIPTLVYSGFADYFIKLVNSSNNPDNALSVIEICKFLDEMAMSKDKKTIDLLITGFFEGLDWVRDNAKQSITVLQKLLHEPARTYLKNLMEWKPSSKK
ncbi:MAG: hypothetical protein AAB590_03065 [Patescibacteria group bacterium]